MKNSLRCRKRAMSDRKKKKRHNIPSEIDHVLKAHTHRHNSQSI